MKRFIGLAAIGRAIEGGTVTSGSTSTTHHRFLQAALYSSSSFSSAESRWFSHHEIAKHSRRSAAHSIAGTMFFSAAASSLAEDVHAKEQTPSKKFLPNDVVLYQYEACPFCNKVKAFLDYHDIPYKIVEVNPMNKKEIKWSDYKKVPILMVDGEQMVDSSDIIDKLYQKIHPEMPVDSGSEGREERKWRGWVDNHLVHVLSPNIYRTPSEAIESFDYITTHGNFSLTDRIIAKYAGAAAMYFVSKKLKKKYNITDERAALYEAADTWVDALKGRNFLGGSTPNLADLAVFGVLKPIRHLKSGRDIVENTHIGDWYARMESMVGASSRIMA
ncbi:Glutathione S-transferase family protein isoform 1 [Actinidia chinensis var. chinensis]|uniref:Prostaglandin E synthase 2 n=1 Tax=Actinidia chinensis var. chinensis TaxID=1590841 RepID=A0A2R6Q061_ACTCC|nr:Glutathione S-transferase family protein isoform 1 [Actinidia chinensis var. chinensis]